MAMLKSAEGKAGAVEAMHYFGDKLKPPTISYQTALAMLEDGDAARYETKSSRRASIRISVRSPGSSARSSQRREEAIRPSLIKRAEKEWLEKFRAANAAGKFEKYFIDKKEAQKWVDAAAAR